MSRCDNVFNSNAVYMYVNDALNQQSTIDYSLCSDVNKLINFEIVEPAINLSDHLPLLTVLTACTANLFKGNVNNYYCFSANEPHIIRYCSDHADLSDYYSATGELLQELLPTFLG